MQGTSFEHQESAARLQTMADSKLARSRSTRVHIAIPVFVYGNRHGGTPFKEITQTLLVNVNGCLVELAAPVVKEQPLRITNIKTNEEMNCTVVSFGSGANGKSAVALRFSETSPRFWGLQFPPEDWDPADRKLPSRGSR
jgi:hypothetical protein